MTTTAPWPITAAARLRAALDATATALAQPNLDRILAAEAELTHACAGLFTLRTLDDAGRETVRDELLKAQVALSHSNRLGASLLEFIRVSLDARGHATGYDPAGTAAALSGRAFHTRA